MIKILRLMRSLKTVLRLQFTKSARLMMRLQRQDCVLEDRPSSSNELDKISDQILVRRLYRTAKRNLYMSEQEVKLLRGIKDIDRDIKSPLAAYEGRSRT